MSSPSNSRTRTPAAILTQASTARVTRPPGLQPVPAASHLQGRAARGREGGATQMGTLLTDLSQLVELTRPGSDVVDRESNGTCGQDSERVATGEASQKRGLSGLAVRQGTDSIDRGPVTAPAPGLDADLLELVASSPSALRAEGRSHRDGSVGVIRTVSPRTSMAAASSETSSKAGRKASSAAIVDLPAPLRPTQITARPRSATAAPWRAGLPSSWRRRAGTGPSSNLATEAGSACREGSNELVARLVLARSVPMPTKSATRESASLPTRKTSWSPSFIS